MIIDITNFLKSADETTNDVHSASGGGKLNEWFWSLDLGVHQSSLMLLLFM